MRTEAHLSECRKYRYWLTRVWDDSLPVLAVIGINPSTADEVENDPTIRKCMGFAQRLGFGGLLMINVAAYRATDPKKCRDAADPIGEENRPMHIRERVKYFRATKVIAAWGKNGNYFPWACKAVAEQFEELYCWGKNSDGTPRHPLMLAYSTALEKY